MNKKTKGLFALSLTFAMLLTTVVYRSTASAVTVLGGDNRYATALEIVKDGWAAGTAKNVVIASGMAYADALAAAPLAYQKEKAPILLTEKSKLTAGISEELVRLGVENVYIVGGTGVVSQAVENELKSKVPTVKRISGVNRFETSLEIAKEAFGIKPVEVVITNGLSYADALSISSIAAQKGMPILLVNNRSELSKIQKNYIANTTVYAVGGTGVLSESIVSTANATRISGDNRYETNAAILKQFPQDYSKVYIAKGTNTNLVDALAGSALAALGNNPIVLVDKNSTIIPTLKDVIKENVGMSSTEVLLGGTVSQTAAANIEELKPVPLKVLSID
ncbi:cell wall-binding repeat-containing protein [Clostridium sp.]|uniref:cell wall-binding repeat-containing protein n=1 Tax=Clostridium sp. TaxID=1506 RepID=UPI003D6CBD72